MNKILEKILGLFKRKKPMSSHHKGTSNPKVLKTISQNKTENLAHKRMPGSKEVDKVVQKAKSPAPKTIDVDKTYKKPNAVIEPTKTSEEKKKPKRYYYKHKNKKKSNNDGGSIKNTHSPSKPL